LLDDLGILEGMEPRKELRQVTKLMEFRLRENDWKSHWSGVSISDLAYEMHQKAHQAELLSDTESLRLVRAAIDTANYAMMVVDNWLRKNTPPTEVLIGSLRSKDKPSGKESSR